MNEHESLRDDLPLHLTGDLGPAESERLEAHLAECAECRRELEELRSVFEQLERAAAPDEGPVPGGFFDERVAPRLRRPSRFARGLLRAAAVLLVFVAGAATDRALLRGGDAPPGNDTGRLAAAYQASTRRGESLSGMWVALSELSRE